MTKKVVTKRLAKKWLNAVKSLRDYYQGVKNRCDFVCPFCTITTEEELYCSDCLWTLFEGKNCPDDAVEKRMCRDKQWCKDSIKRLNRWEKKLNKIIGG